ncbi:MAG: hypothetical protein JWN24_2130 [Phycisphaerales bacterium]|nr:hypothetical protein [Phycisphaerales bacterium]
MWASCLLLLPALVWVGAVEWVKVRGIQTIEYEPVWMLKHALRDSHPAETDAALAELTRRLGIGKLSDDQIDSVAEIALAVQSDYVHTWIPAWGAFIEDAHNRGNLQTKRWEDYLRGGAFFRLSARAIVGRGDPLPLSMLGPMFRYGPGTHLATRYSGSVTIDGHEPLPITECVDPFLDLLVDISSSGFASLGNGRHVVHLDLALTKRVVDSAGNITYVPVTSVPVETSWELVDKAPEIVCVVGDADRAAMLSSVKLGTVRWGVGNILTVPLEVTRAPVDVMFDVVVRADGLEWNLGTVEAIGQGDSCRVECAANGFTATQVDVVLRPNPRAAKCTVSIKRIWGEEIVFSDVPVFAGGRTKDDPPRALDEEIREELRRLNQRRR